MAKKGSAAVAEAHDWDKAASTVRSNRHLRREMALRNPAYFDSHYCGMRWAPHRERWLTLLADAWAEARASLRTNEPKKVKICLLGPREHGKTETAMSFISELVCEDRSVRILIVSEAASSSVKRLARVKSILSSERVTEDWTQDPDEGYGPFRSDGRKEEEKWAETSISVLRDIAHVDSTIEAVGIGCKITGGHFDLILLDDPEDYENVATAKLRKRRKKWMKSTLSPMLEPGGLMVMLGTRKHHDDLYGMALKSSTWRVKIDKAILKWPDKFEPVYEIDELGREVLVDWIIEGDYEVLWPEKRPLKMLLTMREDMELGGYTNFAREMQNDVTDEKAVAFKRTYLDASLQRGKDIELYTGPWPRDLLIVQGIDPAFVTDARHAEAADTDYQVHVTWAASVRTRDRYLLGVTRERGRTHGQKKTDIIREWKRWAPPTDLARCPTCEWLGGELGTCPICDGELQPSMRLGLLDHIRNGWAYACAMEENSAGVFLKIETAEQADIPLVRHWTGKEVSDPYKGVPVLATLWETGRVVLPDKGTRTKRAVSVVTEELHDLGVAAHDDTVLAIWIAEVLLRRALTSYDRYVQTLGKAPDLAA